MVINLEIWWLPLILVGMGLLVVAWHYLPILWRRFSEWLIEWILGV
jgi:hypothetical protein